MRGSRQVSIVVKGCVLIGALAVQGCSTNQFIPANIHGHARTELVEIAFPFDRSIEYVKIDSIAIESRTIHLLPGIHRIEYWSYEPSNDWKVFKSVIEAQGFVYQPRKNVFKNGDSEIRPGGSKVTSNGPPIPDGLWQSIYCMCEVMTGSEWEWPDQFIWYHRSAELTLPKPGTFKVIPMAAGAVSIVGNDRVK
jgi:hypothetical protein